MDQKMINDLKEQVFQTNLLLPKYGLVIHTWGNVSMIAPNRQFFVIKPSGVSYDKMRAQDMVVVDLDNNVLDTNGLKPSSDTQTHALMYKHCPDIKAIVHTHSTLATSFAQADKPIPCLGTTHADNFFGPIPCTRALSDSEINGAYEHNTGLVILEHLKNNQVDVNACAAILVKEHGSFVWSNKNGKDAVDRALTLEQVAQMALYTQMINPHMKEANPALQQKHYNRKHGKDAYYGQNTKQED